MRCVSWLTASCLLCGADTHRSAVCAGCADELPRLATERCPVCALPTPGGSLCGECLRRPRDFDATHAVYRYAFPVDKLIQALKYSRRLASADFLGRALGELADGAMPDIIIPVPLSSRRLAERGFNQAIELAPLLSAKTGARLLREGVRRPRDTVPQALLPWKARARNIRHAFECELDLTGRHVAVVDDVMTTGATLNELARVLKRHGAARVENYVVARAVKGES